MSNIQPYIILNGTDSRSITGLLISALAPISKPLQRTLVDTVDGRDGDLVTPLGFSAYDKTISIALTYGYDIDDIIEYFNSEGVVTFSNEPDKYYRYAIYEQIDFERLIRFKTAEVTLHCQPFKFSTTETPKLFNVTSGSPITVKNDGNYQSRPNLTIIGSGDVDLSLNGSQVLSLDLEDNQAIIIDTEDMNAYAAQTAIKEVIAEINPVQDLHGQEYPYPAGGGKNKLNDINPTVYNAYITSLNSLGSNADNRTVLIPIKQNTNYTYTWNRVTISSTDNSGILLFEDIPVLNETIGTFVGGYITAAGGTVTFNSGSNNYAAIKMANVTRTNFEQTLSNSQLEEGTTATAYAPYENICPITGFTESNVKLYGVNAWDEVWELGTIDAATGQDAPASSLIRSKNYIPVLPQTSYFCYCGKIKGESSYSLPIYCYDKDKNYIGRPTPTSVNNATFTTPANCYYVRFRTGSEYGTTYLNDISFNPATVTTYEPYLGSEYTIEFVDDQGDPITAYKGRINFTTGVLTLDKKIRTITSDDTINVANTSYIRADATDGYVVDNIIYPRIGYSTQPPTISDCLKFLNAPVWSGLNRANSFTVNDNQIHFNFANELLGITDYTQETRDTAKEKIKDYITNNPLNVLIPIEPIEIQLTPTIINNLLGLNQMYADNNGDISVTFSSNGVIQTKTGDIVSFNVAVEDMQKGILLNRLVIGDYDKIRLSKGNNTIVLTGGAQQFVIDKYSRWL